MDPGPAHTPRIPLQPTTNTRWCSESENKNKDCLKPGEKQTCRNIITRARRCPTCCCDHALLTWGLGRRSDNHSLSLMLSLNVQHAAEQHEEFRCSTEDAERQATIFRAMHKDDGLFKMSKCPNFQYLLDIAKAIPSSGEDIVIWDIGCNKGKHAWRCRR